MRTSNCYAQAAIVASQLRTPLGGRKNRGGCCEFRFAVTFAVTARALDTARHQIYRFVGVVG